MRNLKTIENRVLAVLKEHPEARNDDMKLYLLVSKACIYDTHGISHFSFEDVMSNYKASKRGSVSIPSLVIIIYATLFVTAFLYIAVIISSERP